MIPLTIFYSIIGVLVIIYLGLLLQDWTKSIKAWLHKRKQKG